jgi:Flp pilus assembly pilin Flp
MRHILDFLCSDEAASAVEYAVMLAMILMAVIGAISSVGGEAGYLWGDVQSDLDAVGFSSGSAPEGG